MQKSDILIVDDELGIRELLSDILLDEGYSVKVAEDAAEARKLRLESRPSMVLLDIWMPDCDGITLLKEWSRDGLLDMPVVMMSGHGTIETAVEATKIGALDYLEKPITHEKLLNAVKTALKYSELQAAGSFTFDKLGNSASIQQLRRDLAAVDAGQKGNVMLTGECGSPFEVVARYFQKADRPWVHPEKREDWLDPSQDWYKRAHRGVLYIGNIVHLDREAQDAIWASISRNDAIECRIVSACSKPLQDIVQDETFNKDLFNVLAGHLVPIPPLRSQLDDLVHLINQIRTRLVESRQIGMVNFKNGAIETLKQYTWPGNLEQLEIVVKNLALCAKEQSVDAPEVIHVLDQFRNSYTNNSGGFDFNMRLRDLREEVERRYFEYHIRQENNNMSRVAERVGLERTHLYRKLKQLGIQFSKRQSRE